MLHAIYLARSELFNKSFSNRHYKIHNRVYENLEKTLKTFGFIGLYSTVRCYRKRNVFLK